MRFGQGVAFLLGGLASVGAAVPVEEPDVVGDALVSDDQCASGDSQCSLSALQLRAKKQQEDADMSGNSSINEAGYGSCTWYGCHGFVRSRPCQCNSKCRGYNNCCHDYEQVCHSQHTHSGCYGSGDITYKLNWKAEGRDFFRNWTFVTEDKVHGAQEFLDRSEAEAKGVISANDREAILRVGGIRYPSRPGEAYKRYAPHVRSNTAWDPKDSFVVAMKFKHVPEGCGIWPGFWTVNSDVLWPGGGELDVLEYANDVPSKVSFHTGEHCRLSSSKINQCLPRGSGGSGPLDCYTSYFQNAFGCRPRQRQRTGADYARTPGVIAAEWTPESVTVFFFRESEIPADLANNNPKPSTWSKHVIAYLPFESPCTEIKPQEIVLNIQLCGDAAGGPWAVSSCAHHTATQSALGICHAGLSEPSDCCTQWVTSLTQESYMHSHAFFEVNYVKVFTKDGRGGTPSGTFKRGGQLLEG